MESGATSLLLWMFSCALSHPWESLKPKSYGRLWGWRTGVCACLLPFSLLVQTGDCMSAHGLKCFKLEQNLKQIKYSSAHGPRLFTYFGVGSQSFPFYSLPSVAPRPVVPNLFRVMAPRHHFFECSSTPGWELLLMLPQHTSVLLSHVPAPVRAVQLRCAEKPAQKRPHHMHALVLL